MRQRRLSTPAEDVSQVASPDVFSFAGAQSPAFKDSYAVALNVLPSDGGPEFCAVFEPQPDADAESVGTSVEELFLDEMKSARSPSMNP